MARGVRGACSRKRDLQHDSRSGALVNTWFESRPATNRWTVGSVQPLLQAYIPGGDRQLLSRPCIRHLGLPEPRARTTPAAARNAQRPGSPLFGVYAVGAATRADTDAF